MSNLENFEPQEFYCYAAMSPEDGAPENTIRFLRKRGTRTLRCRDLEKQDAVEGEIGSAKFVQRCICKRNGEICQVLARFDAEIIRANQNIYQDAPLLLHPHYTVSFETLPSCPEDLILFAIGQIKQFKRFSFQNVLDILDTKNGKAGLTKPEFQAILDADETGATTLLHKAASGNGSAYINLIVKLNERLEQMGTYMRIKPRRPREGVMSMSHR